MSRRGNCNDNAAMESWFSAVKFKFGETFESIRPAKDQVFDSIEAFLYERVDPRRSVTRGPRTTSIRSANPLS